MMSNARERHEDRQYLPATTMQANNESMQPPPLGFRVENNNYIMPHQSPVLTQPGQPDIQSEQPHHPAAVSHVNHDMDMHQSIAAHPQTKQPDSSEPNVLVPNPTERIAAATANIQQPRSEPTQPSIPTKDEKHVRPTKMKSEEIDEPADSALPFLVVSIVSMLFSIIWFFVKIPIRIGSMVFSFWVFIVALRVLWLLLADDNGAWEIGAGVELEYNMPGIH